MQISGGAGSLRRICIIRYETHISEDHNATEPQIFRIRIEVQGIYSDDGRNVNKYYIYEYVQT